ncbi:hypothetical protein B0J18DRAFT_470658 [Chaetomium sp. MPI-SDFR-AT-0129]|nr:hypothetical protein B0J18DRAFT_470658 [Chaetomium sp. MPI-SDFR-AT-0129]
MRRSRTPPAASPFRALAHHQAQYGASGTQNGQQARDSVSSVLRSFNVETNPARPIHPSPLTASTIPDMPLDLVDRIRSFPLFMSAPDDFLAAIGKHLRPQIHAAHDHILMEGDDAKAMYWVVRGVVAVTSRDGEAVYAELNPGAFFGEIGVLMDMPRTATIIARTKCLLVVLKKEDLQAELPKYPEMEQAIRQEAQERLAILKKKRQEGSQPAKLPDTGSASLAREPIPGEVSTGEVGVIKEGAVVNTKKRKSPSPGVVEDSAISGSALGSGYVNVRTTLRELPLFATLPGDILHFLGLNAQPKSYPPFTDIVRQGAPGNDIFFIVRGEAEVVQEPVSPTLRRTTKTTYARPRLKQGQYFGEVASLGLSQWRTATVRAVSDVECLIIPGDVLDELWQRCPPGVKSQVEETARERFHPETEDVEMEDAPVNGEAEPQPQVEKPIPGVTFSIPTQPVSPPTEEEDTRRPSDPDPFLSVDMENLRNRRRNSLAPPTPQTDCSVIVGGIKVPPVTPAPPLLSPISLDDSPLPKRARIFPQSEKGKSIARFPDRVWIEVFKHMDLVEMIRLRGVCKSWQHMLSTSPELCRRVDLGQLNRKVNDWSVANIIAPFLGTRPVELDISNCFHITDQGFQTLWRSCGKNVKIWRMRSVWDVSASQILEMSECAKGLEEVDWSNCRKVGDNLLARVVGWVVPNPPPSRENGPANNGANNKNVVIAPSGKTPAATATTNSLTTTKSTPFAPTSPSPRHYHRLPPSPPAEPFLLQAHHDRSMAHLAAHAASRLQSLSLTRCTSITDAGFQAWAPYRFTRLTHLCLADCTYLSDNSVVALVGAAKSLTHLDLSFCCALSDTATEVVALGLPLLRELRMAFCGSANVLEGCARLEWVDVSQCKNLGGWLVGGGVGRWGFDERKTEEGAWAIAAAGSSNTSGSNSSSSAAAAAVKNALLHVQGGKIGAGGVGGGLQKSSSLGPGIGNINHPPAGMMKPLGPGPVMRPVVPPRGARKRRVRKPIRFVVEKGPGGLR